MDKKFFPIDVKVFREIIDTNFLHKDLFLLVLEYAGRHKEICIQKVVLNDYSNRSKSLSGLCVFEDMLYVISGKCEVNVLSMRNLNLFNNIKPNNLKRQRNNKHKKLIFYEGKDFPYW